MSSNNRNSRRDRNEQSQSNRIRLYFEDDKIVAKKNGQVIKTFLLTVGATMLPDFMSEYGAWARTQTMVISTKDFNFVLGKLQNYSQQPQSSRQSQVSSTDVRELVATGNRILGLVENWLVAYATGGRFAIPTMTNEHNSPAKDITTVQGLKPKAGIVQSPDGQLFMVAPISRSALHTSASLTGYQGSRQQQHQQSAAAPAAS